MGEAKYGPADRDGQLVAWAVGEARRLRLLGLRIPKAPADGGAAVAQAGTDVAGEIVTEGGETGAA